MDVAISNRNLESPGRVRRIARRIRLGTLFLVLLGLAPCSSSSIEASDTPTDPSVDAFPAIKVPLTAEASSLRVVTIREPHYPSTANSAQSNAPDVGQQLFAAAERANSVQAQTSVPIAQAAPIRTPKALPATAPAPFEPQTQDIGSLLQAAQKSAPVTTLPTLPQLASTPVASAPAMPIRIKLESIPHPQVAAETAPVAQYDNDFAAPVGSQFAFQSMNASQPAVSADVVRSEPAPQVNAQISNEPVTPRAATVRNEVAQAPVPVIDSHQYAVVESQPAAETIQPAAIQSRPPVMDIQAALAASQPAVEVHNYPAIPSQQAAVFTPPVVISPGTSIAVSEPAVTKAEPLVAAAQPEVTKTEPAVVANETPVAVAEPTAVAAEPAIVKVEPVAPATVAVAAPTLTAAPAGDPVVAANERKYEPVAPVTQAAQQPTLKWDASNFAAQQRPTKATEVHVKQEQPQTHARFAAVVAQTASNNQPTPADTASALPAPQNADAIAVETMETAPMPLTNSSFLPANPEGYCYRCGVKCPPCGCNPGGPGWAASRPIPWEVFAQGEYIGPARLAHVPIYRLRVDDRLAFVYRLSGAVANTPYRLNVRDRVLIQSLSAPEVVNREAIIQPDGTISLPLLGQVRAAGTTLEELNHNLDELYRKQIKDPRITVTPLVMNSNLEELRSSVDRRYGQGGQVSDARVSPDGTIQLPAVGLVPAQGMTLEELEREVKTRYARIVEGLEVTPILLDRAPRYIYVVGEVRLPGRFTMEGPTTLMQAIALAGSWNVGAQLNNVVVFRRDENWQLMATRVDIRNSLLFKKPCSSGEIWLRDSDIVLIPKSPILCADDAIELIFTRGIYGVFPMTAQLNFSKLSTL